jgi:hypothetical protein
MKLIEPDDMLRYGQVLSARSYDPADFELHEADTTDPCSDELYPFKGYVDILRFSTAQRREYPTGDGTAWVDAFERDLAAGRFGQVRSA